MTFPFRAVANYMLQWLMFEWADYVTSTNDYVSLAHIYNMQRINFTFDLIVAQLDSTFTEIRSSFLDAARLPAFGFDYVFCTYQNSRYDIYAHKFNPSGDVFVT